MAGMLRVPRSRGALSGVLLLLLGAWGALIPFIGPYFNYAYTPDRDPQKLIGNYWPYATTIFDFIRRAMPWQAPKTLTDNEVYAVTAYILALNKIIGENDVINAESLPKVRMPNRDGFVSRYPDKQ